MATSALTPGEEWVALVLGDLRQGRYRASAWLRFIEDSFRRSAQARRLHPALVSQARRWGVAGCAGWALLCLVARIDRRLTPSCARGLGYWGACWWMLDLHLGMAETREGHRPRALSAADAVTMARFWLVPVLPAVRARPRALASVIALGGVTDLVDGALARAAGPTRLGRDLDSTADLAFIGTAAWATRASGLLPAPAGELLAGRYAVGVSMGLLAEFGRGRRDSSEPRRIGGALRVGGLLLAAAGRPRVGGILLTGGALIPPLRWPTRL